MIEIHLDGTRLEKEKPLTLQELLPERKPGTTVAVIRPTEGALAETRNIRLYTTVGEAVVELTDTGLKLAKEGVFNVFFESLQGAECYNLGWADRYTAAFGPCTSSIKPSRKTHRYSKDDVILGCGGYDPKRTYLIFSKLDHIADHGAAADGGVVGHVVSGRSVLNEWSRGDSITRVERVFSWTDQSLSFTTSDGGQVVEDGMHIISHVRAIAEGYAEGEIDTGTAESVEHLLITLEEGVFSVGRAASTHIRDESMIRTDVPAELQSARLEGTITVRTEGKSRGCVYIYTKDIPSSASHTVVGRVTHGIELVKLAQEKDLLSVMVTPERLDLLGYHVQHAREVAGRRGFSLEPDTDENERIIVGQDPGTTLEVLKAGKVAVITRAPSQVIEIRLDDEAAPATCEIFREVTGLKQHHVGAMPLYFHFEDVYLFKPPIKTGTKINLENIPEREVPANSLAMTNDSRKGSGLVGVRTSANREFGPTSEPFGGTNVIGTVLEPEKLKGCKEGELVFIKEVRS